MPARSRLTATDLITMTPPENGEQYELTRDGELITTGCATGFHEEIKSTLAQHLLPFAWERHLGKFYIRSAFTFGGDAVRVPDLAFVSSTRRKEVPAQDGPITFVPDLAIEVIDPSDLTMQMEDKIRDYFEGGVNEVWLVFWNTRSVHRRTKSGGRVFLSGDIIETPILPGFRLPVAEIFADIP